MTALEDDFAVMVIIIANWKKHICALDVSEDFCSTLKDIRLEQKDLKTPTSTKFIEAIADNAFC